LTVLAAYSPKSQSFDGSAGSTTAPLQSPQRFFPDAGLM